MTDVEISAGTRDLPGYLAVPEGEGPWPGVVVPGPMGPVARITFGMGKGRENAGDGWNRIFAFFDDHVRGSSAT